MTDTEILAIIKEALNEVAPAKKAEFENITADTTIDSLGLDSIARMEMVGAIEESVDMTFADEQLTEIRKIGDLAALVQTGGTGV